jgi:hypothetical protein
MSNFTDFFPAPGGGGGGGGGIPKYQEFITSGTFTPSQALIDAGGRVSYMIVAGGNSTNNGWVGAEGGEALLGYATLTSTNSCTVTIGAGGVNAGVGTNSSVSFSAAGGTDITAVSNGQKTSNSWTASSNEEGSGYGASAGNGIFGYGAGGGFRNVGGGGIRNAKPNTGQGTIFNAQAGSGFVRITWFE